jgi:hypothetical protein
MLQRRGDMLQRHLSRSPITLSIARRQPSLDVTQPPHIMYSSRSGIFQTEQMRV